MTRIVWNERFIKSYQKWSRKHPDLIGICKDKLEIFEADPFHVSLKTHPLHGSLEGFWSFSISYQYRILFPFLDNWKGSVHRNPSLTILNFNKNVSFQMIVLLDTLEDYDQGEHEDLWVCLCTEIG